MNLSKFFIIKDTPDFVVGKDDFSDLQINPTQENDSFYYFSKGGRLVTDFILLEKKSVLYICKVALIKKGDKFTPRISFAVRDKSARQIFESKIPNEPSACPENGLVPGEMHTVRASINLGECHENFWSLIQFLRTIKEIEIPEERFSLISKDEKEIVDALKGRDSESIIKIIKQLSEGISLSQSDINQVLKRREKLAEFEAGLSNNDDESWWQTFFEKNTWIFGYGLNYQILRQEQSQPHYGGTRLDGKGGQKGDFLASTLGKIGFTVLVEIKRPKTPLLRGSSPIRNGAWSISNDLSDAIVQLEANIDTWEHFGARVPENADRLEKENIYTVRPKGILVIGTLSELKEDRSKWESFQRFRKALSGIEILTFDELYERAKFITSD